MLLLGRFSLCAQHPPLPLPRIQAFSRLSVVAEVIEVHRRGVALLVATPLRAAAAAPRQQRPHPTATTAALRRQQAVPRRRIEHLPLLLLVQTTLRPHPRPGHTNPAPTSLTSSGHPRVSNAGRVRIELQHITSVIQYTRVNIWCSETKSADAVLNISLTSQAYMTRAQKKKGKRDW